MHLVDIDNEKLTNAVRKNNMYTVLIVSQTKKEKAEILTEILKCNLRQIFL